MRKKSITMRWVTNNLAIIVLILMGVVLAVGSSIQAYYYGSARQIMEARAGSFVNAVNSHDSRQQKAFSDFILSQVEEFPDSGKMELAVLDKDMKVFCSSRGFEYQNSYLLPSYDETQIQESAVYRGRTINNEHYMALTVRFQNGGEEFFGVRLTTSLEEIDFHVGSIIMMVAALGVVVIFLVSYSGYYFTKSIVIPVGQVNATARKIAMGDYSTRLEAKTQDEIGELCETINYMAEELGRSEKMKNEFISSVSHELRTPLTAIRGWAETIADSPGDDKFTRERGIKVILSETARLGAMVEELLDFSRLQSGQFSFIMEKLDILAEIEETVMMFGERARRQGVELDLEEPEYISPVMGDRNRLKQVFVNVLDNALKYTDKGGRIVVSAGEKDGGAIINIIDDGCGIAAEDIPKVKTKFFKGTGARRGSGIGLAVVDEIVKKHGGVFEIASVLGEGTTVSIILPVASAKV
ncbi:MAG: HAMP domain-containing histidine kinase [Oscillospiraceae bacterium]|nr:HAMP domain-containing histidine kinase [Oscillospiraceae bacterium]